MKNWKRKDKIENTRGGEERGRDKKRRDEKDRKRGEKV